MVEPGSTDVVGWPHAAHVARAAGCPGLTYTITATYFSGRRTNRFAAILPGCDVAARRTHVESSGIKMSPT